jgi:LDH2 family malate/lactate/ureidoglycolate dehydrogenase
LIVINLEAFCGLKKFKEVMDDLCEYMKSTPPAPGFTEVVMPGEIDFRTRQERLSKGIPVAEDTWQDIVRIGKKAGVVLGEAAGKS